MHQELFSFYLCFLEIREARLRHDRYAKGQYCVGGGGSMPRSEMVTRATGPTLRAAMYVISLRLVTYLSAVT